MQVQVLVLSMTYGYVGLLHNGTFCNSNNVGSYQRVLNSKSSYADQVTALIDHASIDLSNQLQRDFNFNPVAQPYLHIMNHAVAVFDCEQ